MSQLLSLFRSLAIIGAFLVAVTLVVAGTLWLMPEATWQAIHDPQRTLRVAERGVRAGPVHPLAAVGEWLMEWIEERRVQYDVVLAADGTNGGLAPLPAWNSVDTRRFFGATETLWQPRRAKLAGIRWSRVVFYWSDVQPRGPQEWRAQHYLRDNIIRRELNNGVELVGLLMGTPEWAAVNPQDSVRAVPRGLGRALNDPQNAWATFVRRMSYEYRDRIDTWIVWNEPDIRPSDPNAQYHAWAGDATEYAALLRTAYLAAKQGNPTARVVFGATTYWGDVTHGRMLFLEQVLQTLRSDPEAAANGYYFDAVALNLYSSPDDLRRIAGVYREVLAEYGLSKPLWITETNAVPYDDPIKGLTRDQDGLRVTMDQQAAYVLQAYAMGLISGYERLAFHSTMDRDTSDEVWGLIRNDGSLRPAFVAYQTAARYLAGAGRAQFAPRERPEWQWSRDGYVPNWQVYLVVIERDARAPRPTGRLGDVAAPQATATLLPTPAAGAMQRISVIWNGDGASLSVRLPRNSEHAALVDKYGRTLPLDRDGDHWRITLPAAAAQSPLDPPGYYFIGGDPVLLIEEGVSPDAPVIPPQIEVAG
jgi:hypothetical protein